MSAISARSVAHRGARGPRRASRRSPACRACPRRGPAATPRPAARRAANRAGPRAGPGSRPPRRSGRAPACSSASRSATSSFAVVEAAEKLAIVGAQRRAVLGHRQLAAPRWCAGSSRSSRPARRSGSRATRQAVELPRDGRARCPTAPPTLAPSPRAAPSRRCPGSCRARLHGAPVPRVVHRDHLLAHHADVADRHPAVAGQHRRPSPSARSTTTWSPDQLHATSPRPCGCRSPAPRRPRPARRSAGSSRARCAARARLRERRLSQAMPHSRMAIATSTVTPTWISVFRLMSASSPRPSVPTAYTGWIGPSLEPSMNCRTIASSVSPCLLGRAVEHHPALVAASRSGRRPCRRSSMSCVTTTEVTPSRCCIVADQLVDDVRRDRVEPGGRLVVEDVLRVHRDRARQPDALAHAARQRGRLQRLDVREPHPLEPLAHPPAHLGLVQVARVLAQRQRHVLAHRHRVEQRRALEQHPEAPAHRVQLAARSGPRSPRRRSRIEPASGFISPMMCLSSTLLPVPLGPSTTSVSPVAHVEVDAVEHLLARRAASRSPRISIMREDDPEQHGGEDVVEDQDQHARRHHRAWSWPGPRPRRRPRSGSRSSSPSCR